MILSPAQLRVYQFIRERILTDHVPPTRVEIAAHFGWKSQNAAEEHLKCLARKGVIVLVRQGKRCARNIRLVECATGTSSEA